MCIRDRTIPAEHAPIRNGCGRPNKYWSEPPDGEQDGKCNIHWLHLLICFENHGKLYPQFLKLLMDSPFMEAQIKGNVSGTTVGTITMVKANEYLLPVPPYAEQIRICDIVNTYTDLIAMM